MAADPSPEFSRLAEQALAELPALLVRLWARDPAQRPTAAIVLRDAPYLNAPDVFFFRIPPPPQS